MKINQNISAVIVNDQLLRNENALSASVKRLSSGIKFNDAKDNPSGMAISFKMQAQINALNRASSNATDGSSMVETIDGAMGEMTEILQRIRELCVQGASDHNAPEDVAAIQQEIGKLKEEVNRISTDTEYNGKKLLDGSLDRRTYVTDSTGNSMFEQVSNVIISDEVPANKYNVKITGAPEHAVVTTNATPVAAGTTINKSQEGTIIINGVKVEIKEGMGAEDVYKALRDAGDTAGVEVFPVSQANPGPQTITDKNLATQGYVIEDGGYTQLGQKLAFVSQKYGSEETVTIECDNQDLKNLLFGTSPLKSNGVDAKVDIENLSKNDNFTGQAVAKVFGDRVIITDKSGFEISFEVRGDIANQEITFETTDIGTLQLQIGANEDQEMAVRVPLLNTRTLYIDDLDVTKENGADRGIAQTDVAIGIVSAARSLMGAYENRLDYVKSGLDATEEDMTTAISRLADVDMAEEMTEYTSKNVLTQASISVLAQANDLPQQVLALLQ